MSAAVQGFLQAGAPKVRQPGGEFAVDDVGVARLVERYVCRRADLARELPPPRTPHPLYPNMWLKRAFPRFRGLDLVEFDLEYTGILLEFVGSGGGDPPLPDPVYWLETYEAQNPIEAHPDFVAKIGGTAAAPLNSAVFADVAGEGVTAAKKFSHFPVSAPNALGGVTDYLLGGYIWNMRYVTKERPQPEGNLFKISTPAGPYPKPNGGWNWLLIQDDYSPEGPVFSGVKRWRLSDKGGWNALIYTPV